MRLRHAVIATTLVVLVAAQSTPAPTKPAATASGETHKDAPKLLWRARGDVSTLDLYLGAGGAEGSPDPGAHYTFVKEDGKGTSPKFEIKDDQGRHWKVKLGQEAQTEVAATRLLWAAGYFVDEDYYLARLRVSGLPRLHRGGKWVTADGIVHGARLERQFKQEVKKLGGWQWRKNPFVGTKELDGLKVMMALLNAWDSKTSNNDIHEVDGQRHYLVSDLGATFGQTGNSFTRSKGDLEDYRNSKFIAEKRKDSVDFVMHSRPFVLSAIAVKYYRDRARMERLTKHIPAAHARWLGASLSQLSRAQIEDCFRAAGYPRGQVEGYARVVQGRIKELGGL